MPRINFDHLNKIDDDDWLATENVVEIVAPECSEALPSSVVNDRNTKMNETSPETVVLNEANAEQYFQMVQQAEQMKADADKFKADAITALNLDRAKAVAHLAEIDEKLVKMGVGQEKRRPGRPRNPVATNSSSEPAVRRQRQKNEKTLKEAIVEVLTAGKADLQTIANKIIEGGYKSNSTKFANTVRVQLYRLEDDKEIVKFEDNTFELVAQKAPV